MQKLHAVANSKYAWTTKSVPVPEGAGTAWKPVHTIRCAKCSAYSDLSGPANLPPEVIRQKFSQRGWEVSIYRQQDNRCPTHAGRQHKEPFNPAITLVKKEAAVSATSPLPKLVSPVTQVKPTPPPTGPIAANPKQLREIMRELEGAFDEVKGRYKDKANTDDTIAAKLHLPLAMVTKVRDEAFGPIRFDPELEKIKAEFAQISSELTALTSLYHEVEGRFVDYMRKAAK